MSEITFINADCMTVLPNLQTDSFDVAFIDCQYGTMKSLKSHVSPQWKDKVRNLDSQIMPQRFYNEIFRVAKRHIIFGENYLEFSQKKQSSGRIFWNKVNGDCNFSDGDILWTNLFSSVRSVDLVWHGFNQARSVKNGREVQASKEKKQIKIHPFEKPILLYKWLLNEFVQPNAKIIDTHLGSAAIAHACLDLGFDLLGIEIDTQTFKDASERFELYKQSKQASLFHHQLEIK